ncbi:hypothetical protein [Amycolatopsis sp. NPDC058986]|uniref:hypothetical protein n=1 Tax=unclassified Amycolatopsis TaxID=2618356 RepID=UPI0036722E13
MADETQTQSRQHTILRLWGTYEAHTQAAQEHLRMALAHPDVLAAEARAEAAEGGYEYRPDHLSSDQYQAAAAVESQLAAAAATAMQALAAHWATPGDR